MLGLGLGLNKGGYIKPLPKFLSEAGCTFAINVDRQVKAQANPNSPLQSVLFDETAQKLIGVLWDKKASPTLQKTYFGDASNYYPFNALQEVTDSWGNVFVRIPKFYITKQDGNSNKGWFISDKPITGGYLPWCFWDFTNNCELAYVDIGKHLASLSGDNKLESKPGKRPRVNTHIVDFRTYAKNNGPGYQLLDAHAVDLIQTLFQIEFATINSQNIMQGAVSMAYSDSHTVTVAESNTNQAIVSNETASAFVVGQCISIGTTRGSFSIFGSRKVTAINTYDASNKAIVFDGAPVNLTVGLVVYAAPWETGWSTPLKTGWLNANNGLYPCAYRGIESPWGDAFQFVDGININEYQAWVCKDANSYASDLFATPYEKLGYVNGNADGLVEEMGHDPNLPFCELPKRVGSSSYYGDYYYRSAGQRVAAVGGAWNGSSYRGLFHWYLSLSSANAYVNFGVRLIRKPTVEESRIYTTQNPIKQPVDMLLQSFAGTTADGYTQIALPNGKNPWFLKFDGTDSLGIMANTADVDILGTNDFAISLVFRTPSVIADGRWIISKNLDLATPQQYAMFLSAGKAFLRLEGTDIEVGVCVANTLYEVLISRISQVLTIKLNKIQTYNLANTISLTSRPNLRIGAMSTLANGSAHAGFTDINLGNLAIFYNGATGLDIAKVEKAVAKLNANYI